MSSLVWIEIYSEQFKRFQHAGDSRDLGDVYDSARFISYINLIKHIREINEDLYLAVLASRQAQIPVSTSVLSGDRAAS
jgi:hypothetical protein